MGSDESHFNVSVGIKWWTKSQDSVHKPQPFQRERRAEAVSNRGPSAYQPNALPLGQTGSQREDALLVEFMYLVFTRMPGESYRRLLRSLLLYLCYVLRALTNSLVFWLESLAFETNFSRVFLNLQQITLRFTPTHHWNQPTFFSLSAFFFFSLSSIVLCLSCTSTFWNYHFVWNLKALSQSKNIQVPGGRGSPVVVCVSCQNGSFWAVAQTGVTCKNLSADWVTFRRPFSLSFFSDSVWTGLRSGRLVIRFYRLDDHYGS